MFLEWLDENGTSKNLTKKLHNKFSNKYNPFGPKIRKIMKKHNHILINCQEVNEKNICRL